MLDYQNKQLLCTGLTVTYEKVTLTRKKNTIKILAKLYESATSHSKHFSYMLWVSDWVMVLATSVLGLPTNSDNSRARDYCACSRCG